jgi:CelD/BcsL family acetyltransferase involved in cellulose biosynthesis
MPSVLHLNTIAELRAAAAAWDDLWRRSDCTSPLARAEPVADWLVHFAPAGRFRALVVAEEGRWLAALPLVERRIAGVLRAGVLPCNPWPSGATLLWDAAATDDPCIGEAISASVARLPWQLVFLEAAMPARASWRALFRAATAADMHYDLRTRWQVGRLAIGHDWPAALGRLSRKHRQRLSASLRKLADRGEIRFRLHADLSPDEVEPALRRAWETEDRGWKGAAGTSVVRTPGVAEFMLAQARWLAAEGRLLLAFLDCGPRNVAFCYGVLGKGVFHSFKIGYDPAFAPLSPGHLLQYHLLQVLHADPQVTAVDYVGKMTEYHVSWRPEVYPLARLAFARRGSLLGRAALWGFQRVKGPSEGLPGTMPTPDPVNQAYCGN